MQERLALIILFLLPLGPLIKVRLMRGSRKNVITFGKDRRELLIPPFVAVYFYTVLALNVSWPTLSRSRLLMSELAAWVGVATGVLGLLLLAASLISFGQSFRIGIDEASKDKLVTTGIFGLTRNPIYDAFGLVLLCQLLVFQTWFFAIYLVAAYWLIHRQVLLEERYLEKRYGKQFEAYRKQVPRYI